MYRLSQIMKIMGDKACLKEVMNGRVLHRKKACVGHFNDQDLFK